MKIVYLITSLKIGGAESCLVSLLSELKRSKETFSEETFNVNVCVIYFHYGPNVKKIEDLGFKTYKISGFIKTYDPIFFFRLFRLIQTLKPNLIHSSLWSANIIGRLLSKLFKIPIVCDLHNDISFNGFFRNFLEKKTYKIPAELIAVSNSVKKSFEKTIGRKTLVIQNGIDADCLVEKSKETFNGGIQDKISKSYLGFNANDFVIGSIGRLEPIKSYHILIKSFEKLVHSETNKSNNIKLCIVGNGSEENNLKKLVKQLNISEKVYFAGNRPDAYKFYKTFDLFALSSQTEGLSMSLLEALSFGLPIVITHKEKFHEVIENNVNGLLVPINDIFKLNQALETIYKNHSLRAKISKNNYKLVRNKFTIRNNLLSYKKLYKKHQNISHW